LLYQASWARGVRGRRYRLSVLVTAAAAGVLAGARLLTVITEWISDAPVWVCRVLGFPVDPLTGTVSVRTPTRIGRRKLPHLTVVSSCLKLLHVPRRVLSGSAVERRIPW